MPIDPVTANAIGSVSTLSFQIGKKNVSGLLSSLHDSYILWKYRRHITNCEQDRVIFDDIYVIKFYLTEAILNHNLSRMRFFIFGLLNESGKLSRINQLGISLSIEDVVENYSSQPFVIEESLLTIESSFRSLLSEWEQKYHPQYFGNDFLIPQSSANSKDEIFLDPTFQGSSVTAHIFYDVCIKSGSRSKENLIRVANHLHFNAAAENSFIYANPFYSRMFLIVIIQIAAKARNMNLHPTIEKMIEVINFANQEVIKDAFQWAQNKKDNNFAQMGNMTLFLATKDEIHSFEEYYFNLYQLN
jgi:hypothetical protein